MKKMKLKDRMFFANMLVMLLAVAGFILIGNQMFRSYFIEETKSNLTREQHIVSQSLDTVLNSSQDYMRMTVLDSGLQKAMLNLVDRGNYSRDSIEALRTSHEMSRILSNYIAPATHICGAAVLSDGEVIYSGYNIPAENARLTITDPFLEEIRKSKRPVWSEMTSLQFQNGHMVRVVMLGMQITHKHSGRHLGECVLFVDESVFSGTYSSAEHPNSRLCLVDSWGVIVSSSNKSDLDRPITEVADFQNEFPVNPTEETVFLEMSGYDVCAVSSYERMNWKIISTASFETAMEKNSSTVVMILVAGVVCVLLVLLVSSLIAYTMIKPINHIADSMAKAGNGDLGIREMDTYDGEMQIIATAFNGLMDKTQQLLEEIDMHHAKSVENEFKILQAQINPHFLYNTIETIVSLITLDMKKEAISTSMSLAGFYRRSLSSGQSMIPIGEELEITRDYLSIQKLRYEDYFDFDLQVSDISQYYIPKLTLQPLIENAIYHGIKEKEGGGKGLIRITGGMQDGRVVLEIYDNGAGIPAWQLPEILSSGGGSFGLSNVDQRIKYKYGQSYGLHIDSQEGVYTRVTVTLPPDTIQTGGPV